MRSRRERQRRLSGRERSALATKTLAPSRPNARLLAAEVRQTAGTWTLPTACAPLRARRWSGAIEVEPGPPERVLEGVGRRRETGADATASNGRR
jgi:hypothetical protein